MFKSIVPTAFRKVRPAYESDIRPTFPTVEELIDRAQRTTESCVLVEQLNVSRAFFKSVAVRGLHHKKYSMDDAKKVGIIVDYIAQTKAKELCTADAI